MAPSASRSRRRPVLTQLAFASLQRPIAAAGDGREAGTQTILTLDQALVSLPEAATLSSQSKTDDHLPLFQPVPQKLGPVDGSESAFQFLERGGSRRATPIREWVERSFRAFPAASRAHLRRRLQSPKFTEFLSAYFELQVFTLLHHLGCSIEVEPTFPGTRGATVDLLARHRQEEFYVEATVCGLFQGELSSNANEDDAVAKIREGLPELHSDLWLRAEGELRRTLSKKRLLRPFRNLLKTYSPDGVPALHSRLGRYEAEHYLCGTIEEGDWRLTGRLEPPCASSGQGQVLGPVRTGTVSAQEPFTLALDKKAQDWRRLNLKDEPFLIAINVCNPDFGWNLDEIRAIHEPDSLHRTVTGTRPFKPYLSRVAGVLVFGNATLGMERAARVQLHQNPARRLPECLRPLLAEQKLGTLLGFGADG